MEKGKTERATRDDINIVIIRWVYEKKPTATKHAICDENANINNAYSYEVLAATFAFYFTNENESFDNYNAYNRNSRGNNGNCSEWILGARYDRYNKKGDV